MQVRFELTDVLLKPRCGASVSKSDRVVLPINETSTNRICPPADNSGDGGARDRVGDPWGVSLLLHLTKHTSVEAEAG